MQQMKCVLIGSRKKGMVKKEFFILPGNS